jgi:hypothetical protein
MDMAQLMLRLRPLLESDQLDDLLAAKMELFAAKETATPDQQEELSALISGLHEEIASLIPAGDWSDEEEDDGIPTLSADGTWSNADQLKD